MLSWVRMNYWRFVVAEKKKYPLPKPLNLLSILIPIGIVLYISSVLLLTYFYLEAKSIKLNPEYKELSGIYYELCSKDIVCHYYVVGQNKYQVMVILTKTSNVSNQILAQYYTNIPIGDFLNKIEKYAVKLK